eukprot:CAMPEP_0170645790 /NCGR_PEP_ID=MMETSP0224-20130122/43286_1 /TAXON_ID=285029 /ORGANISM="Togula jolla, Strain CCCM 725" /LENGTH=193 /DNA_ID=CAMNT_0010977067 /DNA_START=57 /DNA_END=635 /DNA_ORIENTATION=+
MALPSECAVAPAPGSPRRRQRRWRPRPEGRAAATLDEGAAAAVAEASPSLPGGSGALRIAAKKGGDLPSTPFALFILTQAAQTQQEHSPRVDKPTLAQATLTMTDAMVNEEAMKASRYHLGRYVEAASKGRKLLDRSPRTSSPCCWEWPPDSTRRLIEEARRNLNLDSPSRRPGTRARRRMLQPLEYGDLASD